MYNGKKAKTGSTKHFKRSIALVASVVLMLSLGIGATLAWLVDDTDDVKNVFVPASVPPEVTESFNGELKEDVQVINKGNVDVYIRAVIVATWQKTREEGGKLVTTGEIAPDVPILDTDYSMELSTKGWQEKDGYYYCLTPVEPADMTPVLIESATQLKEREGYKLVIEILAQTIQSTPEQAVIDAWGFVPGK